MFARRAALFAGASLSVLALAVPAHAQVTPGLGGVVAPDGDGNVNQLLDISLEGATFESGVVETGANPALALIDDVASGEIEQIGTATGAGVLSFQLSNAGDAIIAAEANATSAATAMATALIVNGISQFGEGLSDVTLEFANSGSLEIGGEAIAEGDVGAQAEATVFAAIVQSAQTDGPATTSFENQGDIAVNLDSSATSEGTTVAFSQIGSAILQAADGGDTGTADIGNAPDASIAVNLNATATTSGAGTASASAQQVSANDWSIDQIVEAEAAAAAGFENEGEVTLAYSAEANAPLGSAGAHASANFISQFADATAAGANFDNAEGAVLSATISSSADGELAASAESFISSLVRQEAIGDIASVAIVNDGEMSEVVTADAVSGALSTAIASGVGVIQIADGGTIGGASLANSGQFNMDLSANATGEEVSIASVAFTGIAQIVDAAEASAAVTNAGSANINGDAFAEGEIGVANVQFGGLVGQFLTGDEADASIVNEDEVSVALNATATGAVGDATANAQSGSLFDQELNVAAGGSAYVENSGSVDIDVAATATGALDADAQAGGSAAFQWVVAADASVQFVNLGDLTFDEAATANASALASALVDMRGIHQVLDGSASQAAGLTNSGSIELNGTAEATGTFGSSYINAGAVLQDILGDAAATAAFDNDGDIAVNASAIGGGTTGANATANAFGYYLQAVNGASVELDVANSGTLEIAATATSDGSAGAYANGIVAAGDLLTGTVGNAGSILVAASAEGAIGEAAGANGIYVSSADAGGLTVENSGSIEVEAVTSAGGLAAANAIIVDDGGAAAGGAGIFTLDNSGDIIARVSVDGGVTFTHGMAIDVSAASNNSQINLLGGGNIYGNVALQAGDVVTVSDGETVFDGIINPACVGSADPSACGVGTLEIADGGSFFMRDNVGAANYAGPSQAYVASLTIAPEGTLVLELPTSSDPAVAEAAYPQIFTDTAEIDGTLVARPAAAMNGLYGDEYFFDNVIDANTLTGTFDACTLENGSPLLQLQCIYDDENNVDLGIIRIAFGDVPGMTQNQQSVADGIDCFYDVALDGPSAVLIAQLFTLGEEGYLEALDQLAGAGIANYVQSFNSLGVRYTRIIDRSLDCGAETRRGPIGECREDGIRLWGQMDYGSHRQDGDQEAATYDTDQWSWLVGVDTNIGNAGVAGISLAKVTNKVDSFRFGTKVEASGWQVGGWAAYDPGPFYLRAIGSFSSYDGDSSREISIGTVEGTVHGDPDIRQWTLGLHAGARFQLGNGILTPFLNLDRINTRLKGFDEEGVPGANLAVKSGTEKRTYATLGTRYDLKVAEKVSLGATLGWQHMFGDRRSSFTANFCDQPQACDFTIISTAEKKDSLIAGISLGGDVGGGTTLRVGYDGTYNSRQSTHSAYLKLSVPLGGK